MQKKIIISKLIAVHSNTRSQYTILFKIQKSLS